MFQHQVEQKRTTCIEIAGWVYFWSCGAFFAWGKVSSLSANPFLMPAFYSYSTCLVCMPLPSSKGCKMLRVVNSAAPTTCHAGEPRCSCPLPFTFAEATEGWRLLLELGWCWQRLTELSYMYMIIYIYIYVVYRYLQWFVPCECNGVMVVIFPMPCCNVFPTRSLQRAGSCRGGGGYLSTESCGGRFVAIRANAAEQQSGAIGVVYQAGWNRRGADVASVDMWRAMVLMGRDG